MYNITLIYTAHNEIGACNSEELLKIIERYNPEVIFEEISKAVYKQCYGLQNRYTLETRSIKLYLLYKNIIHIPVVSNELDNALNEKFEIVTKYDEYRYLIDQLQSQKEEYGFAFLNSKESEELFLKITKLEKLISINLDDERLLSIFSSADAAIDNYENEIIENVYEYSKQNRYGIAILFIGTAHRRSIINKLKEHNKKENFKLNWTYYNCN